MTRKNAPRGKPAFELDIPFSADTLEELRAACDLLGLPFEEVAPFLVMGPIMGYSVGIVGNRKL